MQIKKAAASLAAFTLLCTAVPFAPAQLSSLTAISAHAENADADAAAFLTGAVTDGSNYKIVSADGEVTSLKMCERVYNNGVQFAMKWSQTGGITLDVSGCKTLSFTAGHVDDNVGSDTTMKILLDGEEYQSIPLSGTSELKEITLPVQDVSAVQISFTGLGSNGGVYAIAGIKTDTLDASAYGSPIYLSSADIAAHVFNLNNGTYCLPSGENKLKMSGRTFEAGVTADPNWNSGGYFGINVEGLNTLSVTFGHVDDTDSGSSKLEIYLDGNLYNTYELTERMALQTVELPVKKRFSSAIFIIQNTDNKSASYGFADFKTDKLTDAPADSAPEYTTGKDITDAAFDLKNCTVYPIETGKYEEPNPLSINGRDYDNGIVMNVNWNQSAGFGINTEHADELTFTVGHADGLSGESSMLHIYLDGQEYKLLGEFKMTEHMPLQTVTLPVAKVQSVQFVLDNCDNSSGSYGFTDFRTSTAADAVPFTVPERKTGEDLVNDVFNPRNADIYPIPGEGLFDDPELLVMNGRAYANGVVLSNKWSTDASVGFNTDEIDTLSFTVGHADDKNKTGQSSKLRIYLDGTEDYRSPLTLTEDMALRNIELDVTDVQSVVLILEKNVTNSSSYGIANLMAEKDDKVVAEDEEPFTVPSYTDSDSIINQAYNLVNTERFVNNAGEYELPETFSVGGTEYTSGLIMTPKWNEAAWFGVNTDEIGQLCCKIGHVDGEGSEAATLTVYADGDVYQPYAELKLTADMAQTELTIPARDAQSVVFCIRKTTSSNTKYAITDFSMKEATPRILGDVSGNDEIGADDAQMVLKAYVNLLAGKKDGLNDSKRKAADIDGDGEITATDAQIILKYYVNMLAGKDVTWEDLIPKK
ncbi:MAG: NPCBM/NEW2 domain-containing protein [Oscillospiraceae bacterium]|nr:NPCBM/NEW2 domain-containing protein [Oscillospiraceae bacterium]